MTENGALAAEKWARRRGLVIPCQHCGTRIMLCEAKTRAGKVLHRALDVKSAKRGQVVAPARFLIVRAGYAERPKARATFVNAWHLFTCTKSSKELLELRARTVANHERRQALRAGRERSVKPQPVVDRPPAL